MYIFQSEQVITGKLQFCLKITSLIFKSTDLSPLDYRVGAILGRYIRQNQPTAPSWRLPCYRYGMIFHRSFTDKAILSFQKRLQFCVAAAGRHF